MYYFIVILVLSIKLVLAVSCPTGLYYNNVTSQCECNMDLQRYVLCKARTAYFSNGQCVTSSEKKGFFYIGPCPLLLKHRGNSTNRVWSELPRDPDTLTTVMCGPYNRKGLLCGRCIDGYGFPIYSSDLKCVNCSELAVGFSICLFLLIEFVPVTIFFLCVVLFHVNITAGPLLGYFLFCQFFQERIMSNKSYRLIFNYILSENTSQHLKVLFHISQAFSEFWTMTPFKSLLPPFCISEKFKSIHIQMLTLFPAVYLVFLFFTICFLIEMHARNYQCFLWRPLHFLLSKFDINSDLIMNAFATCLFLSSTTIICNIAAIIPPAPVFSSFSNAFHKDFVYIDPTIVNSSQEHTVYLVIAAVPAILLVIVPGLLLCIYPTRIYGRFSRLMSARKQLAITAFAESLHNCFKDGLNGTSDYRALAGLIVLFFPLFSAIRELILVASPMFSRDYISMFLVFITSVVVSYVKPCKCAIANVSLSYHISMLGILIAGVRVWIIDVIIGTEILELAFIIIPLISHFLVIVWGGCIIFHYVWMKTSTRLNLSSCTTRLTDLVSLLKCSQHDGYQELSDTAS